MKANKDPGGQMNRDRYAELRRILELGAEKARAASAPTLESMYERMGFVRFG